MGFFCWELIFAVFKKYTVPSIDFFQYVHRKYIFSNNHIFKSLLVSRGRITDLSRYLLERLYTELEVAGSISIPRILKNKREK